MHKHVGRMLSSENSHITMAINRWLKAKLLVWISVQANWLGIVGLTQALSTLAWVNPAPLVFVGDHPRLELARFVDNLWANNYNDNIIYADFLITSRLAKMMS